MDGDADERHEVNELDELLSPAALRQRVNLIDLLEAGGGGPYTWVAATDGGEWAGPCPFCGGRDRLRIHPADGRWWCRGCSPDARWHDAIDYIRQRDNCTFMEARKLLAASPSLGREPAGYRLPTPTAGAEVSDWPERACTVVNATAAALHQQPDNPGLDYLRRRGISAETAALWRLGYCETDADIDGLWVPTGIVIPWLVDGRVEVIRVRRRWTGGGNRYHAVRGSKPSISLFGSATLVGRKAAVICEGELDAILLAQEMGGDIGVVSLGSASANVNPEALRRLQPVERVFLAHDVDAAGEESAARLLHVTDRAQRLRVPLGKDVTEFYQLGGDLRAWVSVALAGM